MRVDNRDNVKEGVDGKAVWIMNESRTSESDLVPFPLFTRNVPIAGNGSSSLRTQCDLPYAIHPHLLRGPNARIVESTGFTPTKYGLASDADHWRSHPCASEARPNT
jgi:hypothetical protein